MNNLLVCRMRGFPYDRYAPPLVVCFHWTDLGVSNTRTYANKHKHRHFFLYTCMPFDTFYSRRMNLELFRLENTEGLLNFIISFFFFTLFVFTVCFVYFCCPFLFLFVPECLNANKQWMTRLLWQNVFIYISLCVFQVFIYICSHHNWFGQVGVFVRVCVNEGVTMNCMRNVEHICGD